jgi:hypothetical protein
MSSTLFFSLPAVFAQDRTAATLFAEVTEPAVQGLNLFGGNIIPPTTKVQGYSLNDVAQAIAYFSTSGNNLAFLPNTPFQILYIQDRSNNTATFTVPAGKILFVPIGYITDSPPVIGNFPATSAQAANYVFDSQQIGGKFEIAVNGIKTTIDDPRYIGGPVFAPGLLDGGGSHFLQVGVFLTPLSPGEHTISGQFSATGNAVIDTLGQPFSSGFTYKVIVKGY